MSKPVTRGRHETKEVLQVRLSDVRTWLGLNDDTVRIVGADVEGDPVMHGLATNDADQWLTLHIRKETAA